MKAKVSVKIEGCEASTLIALAGLLSSNPHDEVSLIEADEWLTAVSAVVGKIGQIYEDTEGAGEIVLYAVNNFLSSRGFYHHALESGYISQAQFDELKEKYDTP